MPPISEPLDNYVRLPKNITHTPPQFERYLLTFATNSGRQSTSNCAFPIKGIQLDNYTSVWVFLPAIQRWIPPYTIFASFPVISSPNVIEAIVEAPPSVTQPALASTTAVLAIAVCETKLDYSSGISLKSLTLP